MTVSAISTREPLSNVRSHWQFWHAMGELLSRISALASKASHVKEALKSAAGGEHPCIGGAQWVPMQILYVLPACPSQRAHEPRAGLCHALLRRALLLSSRRLKAHGNGPTTSSWCLFSSRCFLLARARRARPLSEAKAACSQACSKCRSNMISFKATSCEAGFGSVSGDSITSRMPYAESTRMANVAARTWLLGLLYLNCRSAVFAGTPSSTEHCEHLCGHSISADLCR